MRKSTRSTPRISTSHSGMSASRSKLAEARFSGFGANLTTSSNDEDDYTNDSRDRESFVSSSDDDESRHTRHDGRRQRSTKGRRHSRRHARVDTMETLDIAGIDANGASDSIGWNCSAATRNHRSHCGAAYAGDDEDNDDTDEDSTDRDTDTDTDADTVDNGCQFLAGIAASGDESDDDGDEDEAEGRGTDKVDGNSLLSAVSIAFTNFAREIRDGPPDDTKQAAATKSDPFTDAKKMSDNEIIQVPANAKQRKGDVSTLGNSTQAKDDVEVMTESGKPTVIDAGNQISFLHIVERDVSSDPLPKNSFSSPNVSPDMKGPPKLSRFRLRSSRPSKDEKMEQERIEAETAAAVAAARSERRERRRNMIVTRITVTHE